MSPSYLREGGDGSVTLSLRAARSAAQQLHSTKHTKDESLCFGVHSLWSTFGCQGGFRKPGTHLALPSPMPSPGKQIPQMPGAIQKDTWFCLLLRLGHHLALCSFWPLRSFLGQLQHPGSWRTGLRVHSGGAPHSAPSLCKNAKSAFLFKQDMPKSLFFIVKGVNGLSMLNSESSKQLGGIKR